MKKLIVITGASSGIGKAAAIKFSREGYPLLLLARRLEKLEELNLPNSICRSLDVKNFDAFKKYIDEAEKEFGPVDLLLNNAGIMQIDWYLNQDRNDKFEMIDVNLKGVINGMDCVLNKMVERKGGTIINVSSTAGKWTADWRATYNATKFGVHALSEAVRREVSGNNVRILTFAPAIVDTNLIENSKNPELYNQYNQIKEKIQMGITPTEAADVIYLMYSLPQHISIKELVLSHTDQKI